ncbi:MAG: hypothetical protein RL839_12925 [Gammaproteobacteria bacterium]
MRRTYIQDHLKHHVERSTDDIQVPEDVELILDQEITARYPTGSSHRHVAEMLVATQFDEVLALIALGQFPSAILLMHSITEHAALRFLPMNLKIKENHSMIFDLLKRRSLSEIASYYRDLGVWSIDDVKFVKKLATLRNGVAHRNFDLLGKHLKRIDSERKLKSYDFSLKQTCKACAHCIDLCIKAFKPNKRKRKGT